MNNPTQKEKERKNNEQNKAERKNTHTKAF